VANPTQRGTARKGREQGRQDRMAREAMERAEKYAPGLSLDMPDEPIKKRTGGKIKKYSMGGAMARKGAGAAQKGAQQAAQAVNPRYGQSKEEPYHLPKGQVTVEEIGEERVSGPRMRKGGSVSSASKRADGCATKGKTRGKFV
jgi:hypothetical protein